MTHRTVIVYFDVMDCTTWSIRGRVMVCSKTHTPFLPNTAQNVIHRPNSVEILSLIQYWWCVVRWLQSFRDSATRSRRERESKIAERWTRTTAKKLHFLAVFIPVVIKAWTNIFLTRMYTTVESVWLSLQEATLRCDVRLRETTSVLSLPSSLFCQLPGRILPERRTTENSRRWSLVCLKWFVC